MNFAKRARLMKIITCLCRFNIAAVLARVFTYIGYVLENVRTIFRSFVEFSPERDTCVAGGNSISHQAADNIFPVHFTSKFPISRVTR